VDADLDTLATALYVWVDDLLKSRPNMPSATESGDRAEDQRRGTGDAPGCRATHARPRSLSDIGCLPPLSASRPRHRRVRSSARRRRRTSLRIDRPSVHALRDHHRVQPTTPYSANQRDPQRKGQRRRALRDRALRESVITQCGRGAGLGRSVWRFAPTQRSFGAAASKRPNTVGSAAGLPGPSGRGGGTGAAASIPTAPTPRRPAGSAPPARRCGRGSPA
jgi:hypothetical protein